MTHHCTQWHSREAKSRPWSSQCCSSSPACLQQPLSTYPNAKSMAKQARSECELVSRKTKQFRCWRSRSCFLRPSEALWKINPGSAISFGKYAPVLSATNWTKHTNINKNHVQHCNAAAHPDWRKARKERCLRNDTVMPPISTNKLKLGASLQVKFKLEIRHVACYG